MRAHPTTRRMACGKTAVRSPWPPARGVLPTEAADPNRTCPTLPSIWLLRHFEGRGDE